MTVTRRIAKIAQSEGGVRSSAGAGQSTKPAKVYHFPPPVAVYTADLKFDDARAGEMGTHPALILELAAAVLAFAFWMGWRLTQLFASR